MTKAIRFHETGDADVLKFEDIVVGEPGAGEARVRHSFIAVNFADIYFRTGLYPLPLPSGLGQEAAGVVEALTESVEVVHKAYVAATMEAVNAGSSHPLTGQMDAWRVRCMKAEAHARAALEGAKP